jgi:nucleotide-binding universal stress UspA family protein
VTDSKSDAEQVTQHLNPQRIVVPVDDPIDRQQAVSIGSALGRRLGIPVEVVKVVKVADPTDTGPPPSVASAQGDVDVSTRIIHERSVDRALHDLAHTEGTLLCVASSGRRSLAEVFTGSASAAIVHDTRVPLVVVGPHCDDDIVGKVLAIAVDESTGSHAVIEPALNLAAALGLTPMLYQVLEERTQAGLLDARESSHVARIAADHTRRDLCVEYEVLHDRHVARALARLTADDDVAMIALATHGFRPAERVVIPSVVHEVIRHARCPVLLAPRPSATRHVDRGPGARVVVGIDGSPADHGPLIVAADEAMRRHARLEIVHAWARSWAVAEGGVVVGGNTDADIANAREIMHIAVLKAKALAPGIEVIEWLVELGPVDALLDAAWDAELVVVGERRYRPIERWMLGSTTEAMIHRSPVPVIVVPEWTETKLAEAAEDLSTSAKP